MEIHNLDNPRRESAEDAATATPRDQNNPSKL